MTTLDCYLSIFFISLGVAIATIFVWSVITGDK